MNWNVAFKLGSVSMHLHTKRRLVATGSNHGVFFLAALPSKPKSPKQSNPDVDKEANLKM